MAEPKQPKRMPENRVYDSTIEKMSGLRLVPQTAGRTNEVTIQVCNPLELDPPQPEVVSRIINRIKKI